MKKDLFEEFYNKGLKFLSYRPRSEKEIKDYLRRKLALKTKISSLEAEKIKNKILAELKKFNFINDKQFVEWWLEQRLSFRPKGKNLLRAELIKKGIEREIIESALKKISNAQFKILAKKIINKKLRVYKNLSSKEIKQKVFSYLARRGFDLEIIKNVIDETL